MVCFIRSMSVNLGEQMERNWERPIDFNIEFQYGKEGGWQLITLSGGDKLVSMNEILENVRTAVIHGNIHEKDLEDRLVNILAIALGESEEFIKKALRR